MKKIIFFLVIVALSLIIYIYSPLITEEIRFFSDQWGQVQYSLEASPNFPQKGIRQIVPVDEDFGIVVPKINLNAKIFEEIDVINSTEYLPILKKGVAQAKGSYYPDSQEGNVFLFCHSADAFYKVAKYNPVCFLARKLDYGDEVVVFYYGSQYSYKVVDKKVFAPEEVGHYLEKYKSLRTLSLQTGYPPGTTLKRLIVVAKYSD